MSLTPKNWTVDSYTNDDWTVLVADPATIATLILSNTTGSAVTVQVQVDDGAGGNLAQIVPPAELDANVSYTLDVRSLILTGAQRIRVQAAAAGVHFYAAGVQHA